MPRSLRQFRLRTLLVFIAITAVGLGVWRAVVEPVHRQHAAVTYLADLGGRAQWRATGPVWLRRLVGSYYFRQVDALDLRRSRVTNEDLEILADLPTVARVYLPGTTISREGLEHLQKLPQLKRLALWRTPVTDADLKPLVDIRTLEALDLQETRTTEHCLGDLSQLARLNTLKFSFLVTDAGLRHLAQLPELSLDQLQVVSMTSQGASLLPNLRVEHLDVRGPQGTGWAPYLANHPTVTSFRLKDADLSEAELRDILEPNQFTSLYLENVPLNDALLPLLVRGDRLKQVDLRGTQTTPTEFLRLFGPGQKWVTIFDGGIRLSRWPSIDWQGPLEGKDLDALRFCRQAAQLKIFSNELKGSDTSWLDQMDSLQEIELWFELDDTDFRRIATLPKLTTLTTPGNLREVTPEGIRELKWAKQLRTLELRNAGIGDEHLAAIGTLRQLHVLSIPGNPISDNGLAHLVDLDQLQVLNISFCPQLGDAAFAQIAKLPQLVQLSAQETGVTDAGLRHIHGMPYLKIVSVLGSKRTTEGLRDLRKNLPTTGGSIY